MNPTEEPFAMLSGKTEMPSYKPPRSSEVRRRVPFFSVVYCRGTLPQKKGREGHLAGWGTWSRLPVAPRVQLEEQLRRVAQRLEAARLHQMPVPAAGADVQNTNWLG